MSDFELPHLHEDVSYEDWRDKIHQWNRVTSIEPRRRAFAVRTKFDGKYRKLALALDAADLNKVTGLQHLIERLDECFRTEKSKQDEPDARIANQNGTLASHEQQEKPGDEDAHLSAVDKAKLRASKLSAKLAAQGKYQTQPMVLLPNVVSSNPADQFKNSNVRRQANDVINRGLPVMVKLPQVKKHDDGGYYAEYDINDVSARDFLTLPSTQELIGNQSGATITLLGRYVDNEDRRKAVLSGSSPTPLTLLLQADISAKVLVGVHKVKDVINNYEKNGSSGSFNNYGLNGNQQQNSHHFIQHKLFVGFDQFHPEFNATRQLVGSDGSNFNFIVQQTGAKVFLRGKGSGYLEANSGRESFEALHVYISHPLQNGLEHARQLCESLIDSVRSRYNEFQQTQFIQQSHAPPRPSFSHAIGSMRAAHPYDSQSYNQTQYTYENTYQRPVVMIQHQGQPSSPGHSMNANHSINPYNNSEPPLTHDVISTERDNFDSQQNEDWGRTARRDRRHEHNEDEHRGQMKSRNRNQSRSPVRSRHRERRRSRSRSRSKSRERKRRSRSRERRSSPQAENTKEKVKRKFAEEPKKKRKFSEDPKLLEKGKSLQDPLTNIPEHERPPPKLQFRSSKKESKPKVDAFVPPPPMPPMFPKPSEGGVFRKPSLFSSSNDKQGVFKPPPPISILKAAPKALKIGALSSLTAYSDDSDED